MTRHPPASEVAQGHEGVEIDVHLQLLAASDDDLEVVEDPARSPHLRHHLRCQFSLDPRSRQLVVLCWQDHPGWREVHDDVGVVGSVVDVGC